MSSLSKQLREVEVVRGFIAASGLNVNADSIHAENPPRPDIRCVFEGKRCFFELAEVLWQDLDGQAAISSLAHGLALSERASRLKEGLTAEGRPDDAGQIQTWGGFGYPPLASLLQALGKKCLKSYETDRCPLYLLLYYERQSPFEPFEWLTDDFRTTVEAVLAASPFSGVWLYHHATDYFFSLAGLTPGAQGVSVPLRAFQPPESRRRVIGRIHLWQGSLLTFFDSSYTSTFHDAAAGVLRDYTKPCEAREQSPVEGLPETPKKSPLVVGELGSDIFALSPVPRGREEDESQ